MVGSGRRLQWRAAKAATGVAVGALMVMTAACGGGSSKKDTASSDTTEAPTSTTAAPTTTTADPQADAARAKQINLVAADLPAGWTSTPATPQTAQDKADQDKVRACLGLQPAAAAETADVNSDDFHSPQGDVEVSSSVTFVKSKEIASQELAAYKSDKATACLKESLNAVIARGAQGATVTGATLTPISPPSGGDGGFGFNFSAHISGGGTDTSVVAEIQGVLVGRAELSYTTVAIGDATVPASLASGLIAKMVARASA